MSLLSAWRRARDRADTRFIPRELTEEMSTTRRRSGRQCVTIAWLLLAFGWQAVNADVAVRIDGLDDELLPNVRALLSITDTVSLSIPTGCSRCRSC